MHERLNGRPMTLTLSGGYLKCITASKSNDAENEKKSEVSTFKILYVKFLIKFEILTVTGRSDYFACI